MAKYLAFLLVQSKTCPVQGICQQLQCRLCNAFHWAARCLHEAEDVHRPLSLQPPLSLDSQLPEGTVSPGHDDILRFISSRVAVQAPRRFSLDSQPMPQGQYHGAGSLPAPGYGPSRPIVDMEQLGNDLAALLQSRAVLNSGSSARSSLDGPVPHYGSGHHRGSFESRPSQAMDAGFLAQPSHNQRR